MPRLQLLFVPQLAALLLAGVAEVFGVGAMTPHEEEGLKSLIPELRASIDKGANFVLNPPAPKA